MQSERGGRARAGFTARRAGAVAALVVVVATVSAISPTARAQRAIPQFAVDASWPTLPVGWVLGQVASTASDEQDHIWVLHRPRSVRAGRTTGPPVLEFDQDGRYLRGWGGPGPGYDWPESEHGIFGAPAVSCQWYQVLMTMHANICPSNSLNQSPSASFVRSSLFNSHCSNQAIPTLELCNPILHLP